MRGSNCISRIRYGHLFCVVVALVTLVSGLAQAGPSLVDTYEVSYIYNAMTGTNADNSNPAGSLTYDGLTTAPVYIPLSAGDYFLRFVEGRSTGNPANPNLWNGHDYWPLVLANNPGAAEYETGYDGGNVHPNATDFWRRDVRVWVGTSTTDGAASWAGGSLGAEKSFSLVAGQDMWLYWIDPYILDNLGGVTIELYSKSTGPIIPVPGALFLGCLGAGLCAALRRRSLLP